MSKKKDTELEIIDTADGAVIKSGKKQLLKLKKNQEILWSVFLEKKLRQCLHLRLL